MFLGHFAAAMAAKRVAPTVSLGWLFAAWGGALALLYSLHSHSLHSLRVRRRGGALIIATLVVSHWLLDWITHRPDLPLSPATSPKVGLGLWNSVPATLLVEGVIFVVGVWMYSTATTARDRIGRWAWRALVVFLVVTHATNLFAPPPTTMTAVAVGSLAISLLVWWGAWADRRRVVLQR